MTLLARSPRPRSVCSSLESFVHVYEDVSDERPRWLGPFALVSQCLFAFFSAFWHGSGAKLQNGVDRELGHDA